MALKISAKKLITVVIIEFTKIYIFFSAFDIKA